MFDSYLINAFISLCYMVSVTKDFFVELYEINIIVRTICDGVYFPSMYIYNTITRRRMEPIALHWCSHSWITPNESSVIKKYLYHEQFNINSDVQNDFGAITSLFFSSLFTQFLNIDVNCADVMENKVIDPIFILKSITQDNIPYYIVYRFNHTPSNFDYKLSNVTFLSIAYKHPTMENSIELKLHKPWYVVGSELFTPAFVLRALEYQSEPYVFDDDYRIKIIDSNINIVEFGMDKSLVFTEDSYIITSPAIVVTEEDSDSSNDYTEMVGTIIE